MERRGVEGEVVLGEGLWMGSGVRGGAHGEEGMWKGRGVSGGAVERRVVEGKWCWGGAVERRGCGRGGLVSDMREWYGGEGCTTCICVSR